MDKKLPRLLPKPTISDLKVNTLFSAITAKAIENGFSAREVRDDSMRWLVIPAPPSEMICRKTVLWIEVPFLCRSHSCQSKLLM